jgi:hypothetical protein
VIKQNLLAGSANFRPILLEAGENRHVPFRNHFSAMPLHIDWTRSLFFRGATLRKNRWSDNNKCNWCDKNAVHIYSLIPFLVLGPKFPGDILAPPPIWFRRNEAELDSLATGRLFPLPSWLPFVLFATVNRKILYPALTRKNTACAEVLFAFARDSLDVENSSRTFHRKMNKAAKRNMIA